jgi:hypothetical protein
MARREREILEHAVHTIAEQAVKADELVEEATAAGGDDDLFTEDGEADVVDGGDEGTFGDQCFVDVGLDDFTDCERVNPP